jgi:hypothetical protein
MSESNILCFGGPLDGVVIESRLVNSSGYFYHVYYEGTLKPVHFTECKKTKNRAIQTKIAEYSYRELRLYSVLVNCWLEFVR